MSKYVYIGAPAMLAGLLVVALTLSYRRLDDADRGVRLSYWLVWLHLALAVLAVGLTASNPIAKLSCMTGIFGFSTSLVVAGLDLINLLRWLIVRARADGRWGDPRRLIYACLRLLTHGLLTLTFLWCALLCTV